MGRVRGSSMLREACECTLHGYGVGSLPASYARYAGAACQRSFYGYGLEKLVCAPFMVMG